MDPNQQNKTPEESAPQPADSGAAPPHQPVNQEPQQPQQSAQQPVVQDVVAPPPETDDESSDTAADTDQDKPVTPQTGPSLASRPEAPVGDTADDSQKSNENEDTDIKGPVKKPTTVTSKKKKHSTAPIGFIFIVVLLTLAVMGLVVVSYMNQEAEEVAPEQEPTAEQVTPPAPIEEEEPFAPSDEPAAEADDLEQGVDEGVQEEPGGDNGSGSQQDEPEEPNRN